MSQEIQEQLHKQQEVIADKQMSVKEDLDKVEPAVIEAQNGTCLPCVLALQVSAGLRGVNEASLRLWAYALPKASLEDIRKLFCVPSTAFIS